MIIEHRTYNIKPGAMRAFLLAYEAEGLALQTAALGNLLGYFISEVGELNSVVQLWGFESFEDRQNRRATLASNPAWHKYLEKVVTLVTGQRNELLTPASFSPIK